MQSYKPYVVPESLNKRHPYIQEPFTSEIDPKQITLAVKERAVPKLVAVLNNQEVEATIKRDALKTLNEMVSHQETKDLMIDSGVIEAIAPLLVDKNAEVRREAVSLVGSFANSEQGREKFGLLYKGLQAQLMDESPSVQEVDAWAILRLSSTREGCDLIASSKLATNMVVAFIRYTTPMFFKKELHKFFLYLLEAFINVTEYDNGIVPMLGTGTIAALRDILLPGYKNDFGIFIQRVHEYTLKLIGNVSVNHKGKDECIKEQVVDAVWPYLTSEILQEKIYATYALMSCAIHLHGKFQIVKKVDENGNPIILQKLIEKMMEKNEDLRRNAKIALCAVSDWPEGFLKITEQMAGKLDLLDELFGARAIKALAELLPPISQLGENPFDINPHKLAKYQLYVKYMAHFMKKYEEAVKISVDKGINIGEKLGIYINPSTKAQAEAIFCLKKVCKADGYNALMLKRFIDTYGDTEIPKGTLKESTTVKKELSGSIGAELMELCAKGQAIK